MARAYIVLARNDLDENSLQVLDLKPNSSLKHSVYEGAGQTGYLPFYVQNDTVALTADGGGIRTTNDLYYGLAAYLLDNVENVGGGNVALTAAEANNIAAAILGRVAAGSSLKLADINTLINAEAGVSNSDLDGTVANSASTGSVEDILRILAGEVYRVPSGSAVSTAANGFPGTGATHTPVGAFVTRPSVTQTLTKPGGKSPFGKVLLSTPPAQSGTQDTEFRDVRVIVDTGSLHLSALTGALSKLASSSFVFLNPTFKYGTGGSATDIGGTAIPSTGAGRAVTVYAADGSVIA